MSRFWNELHNLVRLRYQDIPPVELIKEAEEYYDLGGGTDEGR